MDEIVAIIVLFVVAGGLGFQVLILSINVSALSDPKKYEQYVLKTDLKEQLRTVNAKWEKHTVKSWEIDEKVEKLKHDFTIVHDENKQTTKNVKGMNSTMTEIACAINTLRSSTDEVRRTTVELYQKTDETMITMENIINAKMQGFREYFESEYKTLAETLRNQLEQYEKECNRQMQNLKTEHNQKLEAVEIALKTDFGAKYDDLDPLIQDVKFKVEGVIMPNLLNKHNVAIAVVVAMFGFVVVYFIQRGNAAQTKKKVHSGRVVTQSTVDFPTITRKVPDVSLRKAICVVSFNENTQAHHKQLVNQVVQDLSPRLREKCPLHYHIVRNHDHIDQLQPANLYILFDNFSDRHAIMEVPGIEQDDYKRTTVHAISQLQADYMIIYVKDPGSRGLEANARYNKNIYSVNSHEVLRMLNQQGRFFSLYDRLSEFQIASIQAIIHDTF